jgi:DUF917 family protein
MRGPRFLNRDVHQPHLRRRS